MKDVPFQPLAARLLRAFLALALLVGPGVGQVMAAERCRTGCDPDTLAAHAGCCEDEAAATPDRASTQAPDEGEKHAPAGQRGHCCPKYCPGCNGRPLTLDTPRLTLSLDPAPLLVPAIGAMTSASFDVPFAIFHPPRA